MRYQIDLSLLLRCDFHAGCIITSRAGHQNPLSVLVVNELQRRLIADKKLPGPVLTDETKHTMFNRIPQKPQSADG
jgi:hypothetical protein